MWLTTRYVWLDTTLNIATLSQKMKPQRRIVEGNFAWHEKDKENSFSIHRVIWYCGWRLREAKGETALMEPIEGDVVSFKWRGTRLFNVYQEIRYRRKHVGECGNSKERCPRKLSSSFIHKTDDSTFGEGN